MASTHVQYVWKHPPRCIMSLNPKPTEHSKPTLLLPLDLSVYQGRYDATETASFIIGCPCGQHAVYLLGYYVTTDASGKNRLFVSPLSLECPACGRISEFFDTRKHGYDGEQGVNTHIIGEGKPDRFACPRCGIATMVLCPNFSYQGVEALQGEMGDRSQDFFGGIDIVGQCAECHNVVEIVSFECA